MSVCAADHWFVVACFAWPACGSSERWEHRNLRGRRPFRRSGSLWKRGNFLTIRALGTLRKKSVSRKSSGRSINLNRRLPALINRDLSVTMEESGAMLLGYVREILQSRLLPTSDTPAILFDNTQEQHCLCTAVYRYMPVLCAWCTTCAGKSASDARAVQKRCPGGLMEAEMSANTCNACVHVETNLANRMVRPVLHHGRSCTAAPRPM